MFVKAWEEEVVIPTYEVGEPEQCPMFLETRVYQGSSGKVYPYPIIEKISDEKVDKPYRAVWLENEYLRVMLLPELGGRIQRAYDKTNGYDFVYHNRVVKPALVGLLGPWISGGIEFNWPQHHRPTTFMPVEHRIRENADGSRTVLMGDVDRMYGTRSVTSFTLYPGKAYIEIRGQLYNPTPFPQTFLWWANPAVAVNDNTQSIFPPDVHAVMDHGKRDVSRFPIATGVYYKQDYSEGVDISRYKNIPVPTSYMAEKSEFDFVGGYDYGAKAGILHVADHHISPGKKQWTWGCGDFGRAWDRNLTDEDGPYIELMTGVFTDNQPDFTWLKPFEEKSFTQYFMPYKEIGEVKNASTDAMVGLSLGEGAADVAVYASGAFAGAMVALSVGGEEVWRERTDLSPLKAFRARVLLSYNNETDVTLSVRDAGGRLLVGYTPLEKVIEKLPEPAQPAKDPAEIPTNEELLLTGLHIEQYRHATYLPDPYYLEGLKRDPGDARINNAYGNLLLRRGDFEGAEARFRAAVRRLTWKNSNPYDGEPHFNLGLALFHQGRLDEAYDAFFKSTWSSAQQESGFYFLAAIDCGRGAFEAALAHVERALVRNAHSVKTRGLKAVLLRKLGRAEEMGAWIAESLELDPFDHLSAWTLGAEGPNLGMLTDSAEGCLRAARDYLEFGCPEEAAAVLEACRKPTALTHLYRAHALRLMGRDDSAALSDAAAAPSQYVFPNHLEDIRVLTGAMAAAPADPRIPCYLGNLYYDKRQYEKAIRLWERSVDLDGKYMVALRNLAIGCFNKLRQPEKAMVLMERAFALDTANARIFLELDQLRKKRNISPEQRLAAYERYPDAFARRDDLYIEYVALLNQAGRHREAYERIMARTFHPWEGGEGKVTAQYKLALIGLAGEAMARGDAKAAGDWLKKGLSYPANLGEGRLEGTKDNHLYYHLALCLEAQGRAGEAETCFRKATLGDPEPAGAFFYNDQPAEMILYQGLAFRKLGQSAAANARFYKLIDYGEQHLFDEVRIPYFAVSLPELSVFDDDLKKRNQAHCRFLIGLGKLGIGATEEAEIALAQALDIDPNHQMALYFRNAQMT
jgi:tetratricopeptide (TPR) repeat protein